MLNCLYINNIHIGIYRVVTSLGPESVTSVGMSSSCQGVAPSYGLCGHGHKAPVPLSGYNEALP